MKDMNSYNEEGFKQMRYPTVGLTNTKLCDLILSLLEISS
jgi:hypothetical protein